MPATLRLAGAASAIIAAVNAHGTVSGFNYNGDYIRGYSASDQYSQDAPVTPGWSIPEDQSNGFIAPSNFSSPDVICHLGATNAQTSIKVTGGDKLSFIWTTWPESHKGPMITYLASCGADGCDKVDKTKLEFFKIDEAGYTDGTWASDTMIANNNTWEVTIPSGIKSGGYVARHETIALHSAGQADGAQDYPFCANLEITSSGSDVPTGTLGEKLYTAEDAGILINIYSDLTSYEIPGPKLYSGASSGADNGNSTAPAASSSAAAPASSSAAAAPSSSAAAAPASSSAPATSPAAYTSPSPSAASATEAAPAATSSAAAEDAGDDESCDDAGEDEEPSSTDASPAATTSAAAPAASDAADDGEDCEDEGDDSSATEVAAADATPSASYSAPAGGFPHPTGGFPHPTGGFPHPTGGFPHPTGGFPQPTGAYGSGNLPTPTQPSLPANTYAASSTSAAAASPTGSYGSGSEEGSDDAAPGSWADLKAWLEWLSSVGGNLFGGSSESASTKARRHARQF